MATFFPMLRRARRIFSIFCLILSIFVAWLLLDSFRQPRILWHTSRNTETLFTILSGCFEFGHPVRDKRTYLNPPYSDESLGWHLGYVADGVGDLQLKSFFPGVERGTIFVNSFGPEYYGPIIAGYWVLLLTILPAIPMLWRWRRTISLIVLPAFFWCGTLALWHRSLHAMDIVDIQMIHSSSGAIFLGHGAMQMDFFGDTGPSGSSIYWETEKLTMSNASLLYPNWALRNKVIIPDSLVVGTKGTYAFYLRYWLATLLVSICTLPILGFEVRRLWRAWLANRRSAARLCLRCGYDLRASPERCPECGEIIGNTRRGELPEVDE